MTLDTKISMQNKPITICACASRSFIQKDKVAEIAAAIRNSGLQVNVVPDLCRKVIQQSPDMQEIASGIILACYPRTIRSHFDWLGLPVTGPVINMRNEELKEILAQLPVSDSDNALHALKEEFLKMINEFPVENGTDAWNPVLDKEKCIECGKCHDFCLFGVYEVKDKQVRVVKPQNCKNNCPACARMCPSKAIIFPKYEKSPINGGTDEEETFNPEEMNKMYNERLRMRLQQRRASIPLTKKD